VEAVRSVHLGVSNLSASLKFFTEVWGLQVVADDGGVAFLRATGPFHHVVSLRESDHPSLLRVELGAADRDAVDRLHTAIRASGQETTRAPEPLSRPGEGYGFAFRDPEGRIFSIVCDVEDHDDTSPHPDRPTKLSHVNLNSGQNDRSFAFFTDVLGFKLSDTTGKFRFVRCNADHHSIVLGFNEDATLNHIAFEMRDLDSVMRGIGRMRDHGYGIEWGPGRHGPGNNVFAYFVGPDDLPLEYTSEMVQVDESYRVGGPQDWKWPPGRLDHWGITPGPSDRVVRAQRTFRFPDDGLDLPL
jgi:catechol 2,3-dioxygenase